MKMFKSKSIISLLFAFVVFLIGSTSVAQVDVSAPDTSGSEGAQLLVPVEVSDLSGEGVLSYDFTMTYDTSVAKVTDVITDGTISEGLNSNFNIADSGSVTVAAAS